MQQSLFYQKRQIFVNKTLYFTGAVGFYKLCHNSEKKNLNPTVDEAHMSDCVY